MKKRVITLLFTLSLAAYAEAATVSGVEVPETLAIEGTDLMLNGAGVRDKWFMDIYVGGLYLPKPMNDADTVINADQPMAIKLHMVSGRITSERMKEATMEGFESATGDDIGSIQGEIDSFMAVFDEEITEGDVFDIVYTPDAGVVVHKNGREQGRIGGGLVFKKAVFGIWLSDQPAHSGLKKQMLGGD